MSGSYPEIPARIDWSPSPRAALRGEGKLLLAWLLCLALFLSGFKASAFTAADANTMMTSFNSAFYYTNSGNRGYFRNTTDPGSGATWFWGRANQMEMLIDTYEATTNSIYLAQFTSMYNGFVSDYGTSWTWNEFNDDIMWAVIACLRAYQKTGNTTFRNTAKSNFDACYARAWSPDLGGGLWWKSPLNTSKNACVNGPAAIAAWLLYQSYNDTNYLAKANDIFLWERATLVNTNTGQVYDSIYYTGTKDQTPITYNEGTYIGAANYLGYTNEAMLAANYTRNSMCTGGILPQYDEHNDLGGFNGIFIRWMAKLMKDRNLQGTYQVWLQQNANAAWNLRRTADNLCWSKWRTPTPGGIRYSFGCWGSVLALQVVPPTQTPGADVVALDASDSVGTSSFESGLNWSDSSAPSSLHSYIVADSLALRTPPDNLHHSFAGSSLTLSNGGLLAIKSTSSGRVITIGTDLFLDNGWIADWAATSAEVSGKATLRSGGGVLDPQGNTMTMSAQIAGAGALRVEAGTAAANGTVILSGYNTYTGGTVLNAGHTIQLSGIGTLGVPGGSLTFSNTDGRGYGTLNLNGTNATLGNLSGGGGRILSLTSGTSVLAVGHSNATGGVFQGTILNGSGTIMLVKTGSGTIALCATNTYTGGTTISGGALQLGDGVARNGVVGGNITNHAQLVFANPYAQTFAGTISGSGAVTKSGTGTLTLSGTKTYTGDTAVNAGTLVLTGGLSGNLTSAPGSVLKPGNAIGTLTIQGDVSLGGLLLMELDRSSVQTNDQLFCAGALTAGGTLTVANVGAGLQAGDAFQLFNQPVTGFDTINLPPLAPGLDWTNQLSLDGSIQVFAAVSLVPTDIISHLAGTNLVISWPADHTGWRLQQARSLTDTNWTDVPNATTTNQVFVPIISTNESLFFRLTYP